MNTTLLLGYIVRGTYTRDGRYGIDYIPANSQHNETTYLVRWDFNDPSEATGCRSIPPSSSQYPKTPTQVAS